MAFPRNRLTPPRLLICYSSYDGPSHVKAVMQLGAFIQEHMATRVLDMTFYGCNAFAIGALFQSKERQTNYKYKKRINVEIIFATSYKANDYIANVFVSSFL